MPVGNGLDPFLHQKVVIEGLGEILHLFLILQIWIKPLSQLVIWTVLRLGIWAQGLNPQWLQSPLIIFSLLFRNRKYCSDRNLARKIDDSGDESGDQENEESDSLVQTSLASQLSYVEALVSLRSRLGPQLCPELTQPETESGASA